MPKGLGVHFIFWHHTTEPMGLAVLGFQFESNQSDECTGVKTNEHSVALQSIASQQNHNLNLSFDAHQDHLLVWIINVQQELHRLHSHFFTGCFNMSWRRVREKFTKEFKTVLHFLPFFCTEKSLRSNTKRTDWYWNA